MRVRYTKELLAPIVIDCLNWSQVCRKLGVKEATGAQTHVKKRCMDFGIDFSHFTGKVWRKGKKFPNKRPIEDYFKRNRFISSHSFKLRLIKEGIKKDECENCKYSEWMGERIVLELDHINEDHFDNRLENLKVLCSNCHAQKTRNARMVKRQTRNA